VDNPRGVVFGIVENNFQQLLKRDS
jgi:hypothetical protein